VFGRLAKGDPALDMLNRSLGALTLVALLAGCASAAQQQYVSDPAAQQQYLSYLTPEKCRALQAVIEDRERYGIVAPSHGMDEDALRRCGLPHSSGGGPSSAPYPSYAPTAHATPAVAIAAETPQDEIPLQLHNGVFAVPVVINQAINIPFILDSGAADVQLPAEVVLTLIRTGTVSEEDFVGKSSYILANGSTLRSPRFIIREMRVGQHVVRNVAASIGQVVSSEPLLGQSFLSKLPSWTLDNNRHVLILAP
jgi:hypothetical protein